MTRHDARRPGLRLELFVQDVEKSISFYVDVLGFRILHDSLSGYVSIGRGEAIIGINAADNVPAEHPVSPAPGEIKGRGIEIVVIVDDIHAAYVQAERSGWEMSAPLARRPWGLTDFRVIDPDGFYVRLTDTSPEQ